MPMLGAFVSGRKTEESSYPTAESAKTSEKA